MNAEVLLELWIREKNGEWEQVIPGIPRRLHMGVIQQLMEHRFDYNGIQAHLRLLDQGSYTIELLPADSEDED